MLNAAIFREYDIRGVADVELRDMDVERHGGDRVSLGRDCRLSSERLRNALVSGLKASGCQIRDIGVTPTIRPSTMDSRSSAGPSRFMAMRSRRFAG